MSKKAHTNPKSLKWLISLAVMIIIAAAVVACSIFVNKAIDEKNNKPVELDFTISSTTPIAVAENELNITNVETAFDEKGNIVAYVITGTTVGYNQESPIKMATTITADASIVCGIDILEQDETEYLGVRIMEDGFQNQFDSRRLPIKSSSSIEKGSGVDVIARSTVSSQAVIDGVNNAMEYVKANLAE